MTVDDIFALQEIKSAAVSPDGEWVAAVVRRPQSSTEIYARDYLDGDSQSDIWLVSRRTGESRNLTNGANDASGFWQPVWSPSGRRLAMVSTKAEGKEPRGGDNIRLYIWDRKSESLTRLATRGVDVWAVIERPGASNGPIAWLSDSTTLVQLYPDGLAPDLDVLTRTPRIASREWVKEEQGETTASVLESGGQPTPAPVGALTVIDVVHGTGRTVAEIPMCEDGRRRVAAISSDGRRVALLVPVASVRLSTNPLLSFDNNSTRLGMVPLDGSGPLLWVSNDSAADGPGGPVFTKILGWSPTGGELAVLGTRNWPATHADAPYVVTASTGVVRRVTPPEFTVSALVWSADGSELIYGRLDRDSTATAHSPGSRTISRTSAQRGRSDWWQVDRVTPPRKLTGSLSDVPAALLPTADPSRFVGVAGGSLWAIDVSRGTLPLKLTNPSAPRLNAIVWPTDANGVRAEELIVEGGDTVRRTAPRPLFRVRLAGSSRRAMLAPMERPAPGAHLVGYTPVAGGVALFEDDGPTGTSLWATGTSGPTRQLLVLNGMLAGISAGRQMLITYRGADGDTLKADVLLPPDYHAGQRYPVVVWVYAGDVVSDTTEYLAKKNLIHPLNMQLLAAHGYVVLFPSMPLAPEGIKSDPYLEIPKGVLPAVDRLVELGVAEPSQVGVMGQSYGGYSTYALVTYTHRFRAAVAMAGLSDLVSLYGQFDVRNRYLPSPQEDLFQEILAETGQVRMGGSPWDDLWHYQRNSPIFFLDRVDTPVMIIQGDMDYVTMTQGEEFFTGLYRRGKRARFVRYWGDEHVIGSPGNVRHMWAQIFDWFDTNLRSGGLATGQTRGATAIRAPTG